MRKQNERRFSDVNGRIHAVYVLLVQLLPELFDGLAEALEMDDFPFPEETDHVIDIGVVTEPQDVVIGHPCLLLRHMKNATITYNI